MILNHPSILQKFSLAYTSPTSNGKVLEHSNPGTKRLDSKSKIIFGIPLFPSHLNPNTHTPQGRKNLCLLSLHVPQDSSVFTLKATVYKKKKKQNPPVFTKTSYGPAINTIWVSRKFIIS